MGVDNIPIAATNAAAKPYDANVPGMSLSGSVLIRFELSGVASGKRRNDVKVGMVQPHRLKLWDIASDEAPFHGGDESAPKPLSIFFAGIVTCFMTQIRTFALPCGVKVNGLKVNASIDWTLLRDGMKPYMAKTGQIIFNIEMDTDAPLQAQQLLVRAAAKGCFAEASLREVPLHRLLYQGEWVECDVS
jgi:uncharacterized OsmC-like protein